MACWLRRCHECNFPLGSKELFCPRCGAKQRREKLKNQLEKNPLPFKGRVGVGMGKQQ
jgi:rRNA maturation endonuclease Nob1